MNEVNEKKCNALDASKQDASTMTLPPFLRSECACHQRTITIALSHRHSLVTNLVGAIVN